MALPVPEYEYDYEQYEYDHEKNRRRARLVDEPEPGPELYHAQDDDSDVCEVTSRSTAADDRAKKILGYARAGIPVYLLIDRQVEGGAIFVYSKPEGDSYTRQEKYTFSQTVPPPDPLGFELDTSEL
ncbi:Uma2 family endonuclease [Streptomyces sp. CB03234]|uniref:Uma2 family endonuclease n=1 Tax=Streptomyces sp. (strain CB03234) TaxID=1703937 RepID=UPI00093BDC8B|nr:Uma2 family endonuclease [Streptomyces sp. CB03234]